jgi:hypothetical protein
MIGYKDRTYCGSDVKVHTCGRDFTEQDAIDAEEWWGGKDYPVAYMNFCDETDNTQPDHIVDMHEMVTDTNQASEVKRNSLNKSDIDVKLERIESDEYAR